MVVDLSLSGKIIGMRWDAKITDWLVGWLVSGVEILEDVCLLL